MNDFSNRLRFAMDSKRLNASELSKLSGVGKNLISYYLHGRCLPKQDKCYLLAKALSVDAEWLMGGDTDNVFLSDEEELLNLFSSLSPQNRILAKKMLMCVEDEEELFNLFSSLSPKNRSLVIKMMKLLIEEED